MSQLTDTATECNLIKSDSRESNLISVTLTCFGNFLNVYAISIFNMGFFSLAVGGQDYQYQNFKLEESVGTQ